MEKVPESIPYLINRGRIEEAHALVQKLEAEACVQMVHHIEVVPVAMRQKVSFKQLWSGQFARRSLMLWLIWFGIVYSYYGIFTVVAEFIGETRL